MPLSRVSWRGIPYTLHYLIMTWRYQFFVIFFFWRILGIFHSHLSYWSCSCVPEAPWSDSVRQEMQNSIDMLSHISEPKTKYQTQNLRLRMFSSRENILSTTNRLSNAKSVLGNWAKIYISKTVLTLFFMGFFMYVRFMGKVKTGPQVKCEPKVLEMLHREILHLYLVP